MFYLAIVLYLALDGFSPRYLAPNGIEWWFIPLTALFLHGLHPETIDSVVPGGWSVAVEMSFYLVLPFILRRWSSMRSYAFLLLFSVSLYAINKIVVVSWLSDFYPTEQQYLVSSYAFYNFFGQLPVFLMGMMAYQACKCEGMLRQLMLFGGLLVLVIPLAVLAVPVSVIIRLLESHLTAGAVFALLVVLLMRVPVLAIVNPLMTNLGKISFSMYLIHGAVLELYSAIGLTALCGRGDAVSVVFYLCVVTTTACVSYGTYKCIEAPGINFGKRLIRKLEHDNRSATSDQSVN
jgi:peptidoglycan/LPS O-acetylase OafA/YrhL